MATAIVSYPRPRNFWWVLTNKGISATQVVQLVAQKLINATLPRRSDVVRDEPSSSVNVVCGAAEEFMQPVRNMATATMASSSLIMENPPLWQAPQGSGREGRG